MFIIFYLKNDKKLVKGGFSPHRPPLYPPLILGELVMASSRAHRIFVRREHDPKDGPNHFSRAPLHRQNGLPCHERALLHRQRALLPR